MKLLLALAVSALAAKPVPIKVQAGLNKPGGNPLAQQNLGAPFLSPTMQVPSLQGLKPAPNPLGVAASLNDFNAQNVKLGQMDDGQGGGENKVTAMAQAETAALSENAALTFDGYEQADTLEEPGTSLFARFANGWSRPVKANLQTVTLTPAAPLGLESLKRRGGRWGVNGRRLQKLGQGTIGTVEVHPNRPGLIVKTIEPNVDQLLFGASVPEAKEADFAVSEVLAKAGVGPRVLGTAFINGRHVSVRERVFGRTMMDLVWSKQFGEAEEALVLDMVRRMAAANTLVGDMKPENIMIGTTEKDPQVKAWFVDGGMIEEMPQGLDDAARAQKILDYPNVVTIRADMNSGQMIMSYKTLRQYLQEPRDRREMPRWKYILKSIAKAYLSGGGGGMIPR